MDDRIFTWPEGPTKHYHATPNPADEPEACGLETIATLDDPNAFYSFDSIIAWRDQATGVVYLAADYGCSCPTPFEGYAKLSDLTRVTTREEAQDFVRQENGSESNQTWPLRDVLTFLDAVEQALSHP